MMDRARKELTSDDIAEISGTNHSWGGEKMEGLSKILFEQRKVSVELDEVIRGNLGVLGYGD